MEREDNNTNQADPASEQGTGEKTFTQDDVNRIIGERLAKEKAKGDIELSKREQELQQKELRIAAREQLLEKGLPVELSDALNCGDAESMKKSIEIISSAIAAVKSEASKVSFRGFQPGVSDMIPGSKEDARIREAMKLT